MAAVFRSMHRFESKERIDKRSSDYSAIALDRPSHWNGLRKWMRNTSFITCQNPNRMARLP